MNVFSNWHDILRVLVVGSCAYLALVVLLRGFGKRTLSKLNAFDFVVTIALGSILATILLDKQLSLAEGVAGLALLMTWQLAFTWLSSRYAPVRGLITSEPRLVAHEGRFLHEAMRKERLAEEEILQAVRAQGRDGLDQVRSVVLEPDGSLSVIPR